MKSKIISRITPLSKSLFEKKYFVVKHGVKCVKKVHSNKYWNPLNHVSLSVKDEWLAFTEKGASFGQQVDQYIERIKERGWKGEIPSNEQLKETGNFY